MSFFGKHRFLNGGVFWLLPVGFLAVFYFYPLGSILAISFSGDDGWQGALSSLQSARGVGRVLGFTIWQALLSTLLTLALGLPGAYVLARYRFPGKSLVQALAGVPFVMPAVVVAAGFSALLGPRGWVNLGLMNLFDLSEPPVRFFHTLTAILTAHVFYNTTIVLRTVGDYWSHMDPRLEQAARVLGANRWQAFQKVTIPLLAPAVASAAMLVFIFDFTSFGVILLMGGPRIVTLEVEIYNQVINFFNLPLAGILSALQLACTLAFTLIYTRLAARLAQPFNLKPGSFTRRALVTWPEKLFVTALLVVLVGLLITPLLALVVRSFSAAAADGGGFATLDFYRELNTNRRNALFFTPPGVSILVSFGYAAATVVLALAIGLPAAWTLSRDAHSRINRWMDPLLMLPLGTSAVTLGLGFIVALDTPPLDLRASPLLVPLAHTLVAFPFVVRNLTPALRSIRPRLHQAAAVLGASPLQTAQRVDLPLVGRAVLGAAIFAFTISIGEFGATALLARPEYPTLPVVIYRLLSQPGDLNYGQAMALSTILMVFTASGMLVIERFRVADVGEF